MAMVMMCKRITSHRVLLPGRATIIFTVLYPKFDTPRETEGDHLLGGLATKPYNGWSWWAPTGSPPSPPPSLIRPSRRRLRRSPRLSGPGPRGYVTRAQGHGCQRQQHPLLIEAHRALSHDGDPDSRRWFHFLKVLIGNPWRRPM